VIMLHGDDKGLVIPPHIALIQVVIVPIYYKEEGTQAITKKALATAQLLTKAGFAVQVDSREQYTPGWKFNEWELKGVPLRIEIGPKDVEKRQVTMVRRDNSQRTTVDEDKVVAEVGKYLEDMQAVLFAKAKTSLEASISQAQDYDQFREILEKRGGFIRACWCGSSECEDTIKADFGATIRTIPFKDETTFSSCIQCGKPASKVVYFARAY
jgi:prolyl-tRNA synthetase